MSRARYYRQRAEECMRDVDDAPDYMKLKLLGIAQQWSRLAEFAARDETGGDADEEFDAVPGYGAGGDELGA